MHRALSADVLFCRTWHVRKLRGGRKWTQCLGMMTFTELPSDPVRPSNHPASFTDQLRLAAAACLARFKGSSRYHTESDLRCYLDWCAERGLEPLTARRPHPELYIQWMQEIRRFTTMVDAGVDLRDVRIADRHAHPGTTMRCDQARKTLGHPTTSWPPT